MSNRSVVSVTMGGREYKIRSDADAEWLTRVAAHVDESMARIKRRTDTVDSLAIATLAALNIARELVALKESGAGTPSQTAPAEVDDSRLRALIDLAEAAAGEAAA